MRYVDRSYSERPAQYMYIVFFARKNPRIGGLFFLKYETNTRHTYYHSCSTRCYKSSHMYQLLCSMHCKECFHMYSMSHQKNIVLYHNSCCNCSYCNLLHRYCLICSNHCYMSNHRFLSLYSNHQMVLYNS